MASSAAVSTGASPTIPPQGQATSDDGQAGILEGVNPVKYNKESPIVLFIVQASRLFEYPLLHYPLSKIRQPRVIAEVIGGIILGPSVMGRIPGFTENIFPTAAMPNLNLVANIGLTLFLFLVGLEVDIRIAINNWKVALSVGVAGMALPFGLGCAIAVGLYNQFRDDSGLVDIDFGIFMLFVGVAMAITAFPVLCRILSELKLLMTPVGIIVLSAGVGNDVVGWILLALCVALVNAGNGLTALWVLLTCVGYAIFLVYAVRPIFIWILRRSRALQDGPSQSIIALTLLLALGSAFFTGIIGVHAIFGAFIAGMICPHEGGFAIKVAEKIEDLIGALFLPLYFTLSGLNTNIGLLDSGIVWAYVIGIIVVAFSAKFIGAAGAARVTGMLWRECFAIGSLMSCKGLVELIVLNIGLQAKILSPRTFTMFVVMALVTTFATSPLTSFFYPPWYQKKVKAFRSGEIDWDGKPLDGSDRIRDTGHYDKLESQKIRRVTVYLRLDSMPNLLAFASLFGGQSHKPVAKVHPIVQQAQSVSKETGESSIEDEPPKRPIEAYGLRLLNLTDRGSSVMQVSEVESYTAHDPVVNTFRTFGRLHNLAVSGEVVVVPEDSFADVLGTRSSDSDFLLLPWSETGGMSEQAIIEDKGTKNKLLATSYVNFIESTFEQAVCATAVLINKNFGGPTSKEKRTGARLTRTYSNVSLGSARDKDVMAPIQDRSHHIFFPFVGGNDDRAALRLVLQLAENPDVTATIVHFEVPDFFWENSKPSMESASAVKGLEAKAMANSNAPQSEAAFFTSLQASLPVELSHRVVLESTHSSEPVKDVITRAKAEVGQQPKNAGDLVVLGRNISRKGLQPKQTKQSADEITPVSPSNVASTLGVLAERVWESKLGGSILVVKAAARE
ncbi:K(+)/H(+) antiporter-like protein 1 [Lojkania enalia]|uniref:K(+)/H(+) antiporter-like protein 1 n=1 Tax=Lojkania enalia TaxID=147567 RepID=A0A9P4NCX3_9PLEO|nr:K(+)/H(+) antiporter-like protein 1 [Didymosphaeria enalia]